MKQQKDIIDSYLESIGDMQEAEAPAQFYSRLRARMERSVSNEAWSLPFRPSWVIGLLAILLVINGLMLQGRKESPAPAEENQTGIMEFVQTYNQSLPSTY